MKKFSTDDKPSKVKLREQTLNRLSPIIQDRGDFRYSVPHLPKIKHSKVAFDLVDKDDELNCLIDRYLSRIDYMADLLDVERYTSHSCRCCWNRNKENLHRNRSKVEQKPLNGYSVEDAYYKAMTPRLPQIELELPSYDIRIQTPFGRQQEKILYKFPSSAVDIDVDRQIRRENRFPDSIIKANSRYEASMRHLQDMIRDI